MIEYNLDNDQERILDIVLERANGPYSTLYFMLKELPCDEAHLMVALNKMESIGLIQVQIAIDNIKVVVFPEVFNYYQNKENSLLQKKKDEHNSLIFEAKKFFVRKIVDLIWWSFGFICCYIYDRWSYISEWFSK